MRLLARRFNGGAMRTAVFSSVLVVAIGEKAYERMIRTRGK
jgi:hypothetical protein